MNKANCFIILVLIFINFFVEKMSCFKEIYIYMYTHITDDVLDWWKHHKKVIGNITSTKGIFHPGYLMDIG